MPRSAPIAAAALMAAAVTAFAPAVAVQNSQLATVANGVMTPDFFIRMQLQTSDLLLLGTIHQKPRMMAELIDIASHLPLTGVTHVALEIPSDQQQALNHYMATGKDLTRIRIHPAIDCEAYRTLLTQFRNIPTADRPFIIAMDMPTEQYQSGKSRDHWMADRLLEVLDMRGPVRILAIAGNLHMFKELSWTPKVIHGHRPIHRLVKIARPDKRVVAIGQTIDASVEGCDFTRAFGIGPEPVAIVLDDRFRSWTLGLGTRIAIRPTPPHRLLDGLIIYPGIQ